MSRGLRGWLLDVLVCPGCGGRLAVAPGRAPILACRRCGGLYPVLADAPVVVPSPPAYLAGYRDAALATLAERGRATAVAVATIDGFAQAAPRSEPLAFGDDWVADEGGELPWPACTSPAAAVFARFLDEARTTLDDTVIAALPARRATVVELGAGAGVLAARLAATPGVERLVVGDLSLRAALRAAQRASSPAGGRRKGGAEIAAVVLDAESLPLANRRVDVIVAAELIDLLDEPEAFLAAARTALRARGRLVLATPDPALGGDDPDRLVTLLTGAGWRLAAHHRGVPWVRPHGARHYQVYFADVIAAEPR